jgi:hypothetical protein
MLCGRGRGFCGIARPLRVGSKNVLLVNKLSITCSMELTNHSRPELVAWVVECGMYMCLFFVFVASRLRRHIDMTPVGHFSE